MWQVVKNLYHLGVAFLANIYYGFPSEGLRVIGVTGTSGKTTTTHMIYEMLKSNGFRVSMISSIHAEIGGKSYDTGFHVTTPDPENLPKYLKIAKQAGDTYFVIEVSSHALDQNRVACINFFIGVLTTLAHEHLDYHKTFKNYAKAKFKLLLNAKHTVVPYDGIPGSVCSTVSFNKILNKAVTFGLKKGDEAEEKWKFKLKMPGEFNIKNALAAAAVGLILNVPNQIIKGSLERFSGIPGRFEEIPNTKGFTIIIDFAHKPDALEALLNTAFDIKEKGRIIVMYGCASERDVLKRPMMGRISGRLADITVLTDEDPRFEDSDKIIAEIAEGCEEAGARLVQSLELRIQNGEHVFFKIPNRKEAIEFIIKKLAKKGDIILLCGKGHETSMSYHGKEIPWSEHKTVLKALE
ncbi:MAG: hypothetical protein A3F31_04630 [Candidatus Levybacteria bacterium RIFCSPHIGHO2_12_FULL_38_12]|nr:MAG: hypothetical protein A3F31_04630 [Candidatus Levybacteria bacterium RIFCSPHIGHO2_12_FULL_38_12]